MKYVSIFHANLNYAYLIPESYERVIRSSYEVIIDTFREEFPEARYVFEASGYTIDEMVKYAPDVVEKLKAAVASGQCEFMGAPYSHPIMANIPEEDGYWSCEFAQRTYEKHLGFRAKSFWNPEMTWMQYVPCAFRRAGVEKLVLDFESYMMCNDKEYHWTEKNWTHEMGWAGLHTWSDLDPNCRFLHRPFKNVVPGLDGMARSARVAAKYYVGYFRGSVSLDQYIDSIKKWSGARGDGALIIMADDAEYVGTTGYYHIKYEGDYSRTFLSDPLAREKLRALIPKVLELGRMVTFTEACETVPPVDEPYFVEDRFAWNRTYADAWASTPESKDWEPLMLMHRKEYKEKYQPILEAPENKEKYKEIIERFWLHMTNSANSDGRWPPPPRVTCAFNRTWCLNEIARTRAVLDEMKELCNDMPLPKKVNPEPPPDGEYGFHFTDKEIEDVRHLNMYELQHAIFVGNALNDSEDPANKVRGKAYLKKVFDEFVRRGIKGIPHPALQ
jgi:hypothetical protein